MVDAASSAAAEDDVVLLYRPMALGFIVLVFL